MRWWIVNLPLKYPGACVRRHVFDEHTIAPYLYGLTPESVQYVLTVMFKEIDESHPCYPPESHRESNH